MTTATTVHTHLDLPAETRGQMCALLNRQLADTIDLYSQTKQAHWNVKGPYFHTLHQLFDQLAEAVESDVDTIAERVTALGGAAQGTVRMASAASRLPEFPQEAVGGLSSVEMLVTRYASLAATMRNAINIANEHHDANTADLFTEIARALDKSLWLLEAHVQEGLS